MNALTKLNATRSPLLRALVAALLVVIGAGGGYAIAAHKTLTLNVDGNAMTVTTVKSRVSEVLADYGYALSDRDDVAPAKHDSVRDGDTIVLKRSRPLDISVDGQDTQQVWTTASTVNDALSQLSMTDTAPTAATRGSRLPLEGMSLAVVSAKTVQLNDGGVISTPRIAAPTVGALLEATGNPLQQFDTVDPAPSTPVTADMPITVTRIRVSKVTEQAPLAPTPQKIEDPEMNMSRSVVQDPGAPGTQDIVYSVLSVNGRETGRIPVSNNVLTPARDSVLRVGAKPGTEVPAVTRGSAWDALAQCEAGATGPSTPATGSTAACSSTTAPGWHTAAASTRPAPTSQRARSRSRSRRRHCRRRGGALGRYAARELVPADHQAARPYRDPTTGQGSRFPTDEDAGPEFRP
ncbi:resuscitation-promoting factor RpfB [Mycobacteroides abscessus]|nr:resuscitation-promoting factor RpfB [Mycobacteroides abscessus]